MTETARTMGRRGGDAARALGDAVATPRGEAPDRAIRNAAQRREQMLSRLRRRARGAEQANGAATHRAAAPSCCRYTSPAAHLVPPSSSGLGHRPFKPAARIRIPLGAPPLFPRIPHFLSWGAAGTLCVMK